MGSGASTTAAASESFIDEALGPRLLTATGKLETATALSGKKQVGFYFAADRYPVCKKFAIQLAATYNIVKDKGLEIVFCSSDRTIEDFNHFRSEMPWLALPFDAKEKVMALKTKFSITSLPRFIIVDAETGDIITDDGKTNVRKDPKGENFPWKKPTFLEALLEQFYQGEELVGRDAIRGKTLGLLFTASWCKPGVELATTLAKWYALMKPELGEKFEILYCGSDTGVPGLQYNYSNQQKEGGNWLAVPMENQGLLDQCYGIKKLPAFLIVDEKGQIINENAKCLPDLPAKASDFPFPPPPIGLLSSADRIVKPAMCLMLENCTPELQNQIIETIKPIAEKHGKDGKMLFFAAKKASPIASSFRALAGTSVADCLNRDEEVFDSDREDDDGEAALSGENPDTPTLLLVDLVISGTIYSGQMAPGLTGENVEKMIDQWNKGELQKEPNMKRKALRGK